MYARVAVLLMLAGLATPALAQDRPAPPAPAVSAQPQADATAPTPKYQQFAQANGCQYQGDCAVFFPPTASRVLMVRASCFYALAVGAVTNWISVGSEDANPRNYLQSFYYTSTGGLNYYGINAEIYLFYKNGQQPRLDVYSNGAPVQYLSCTLTGNPLS